MAATSPEPFSAYRTFVTTHRRLPKNLRELARECSFPLELLRSRFPTIHAMTEQLWEDVATSAGSQVSLTPEFPLFSPREKITALFLAVLDECNRERGLSDVTFPPDLLRPISRGLPLLHATRGLRRGILQSLAAARPYPTHGSPSPLAEGATPLSGGIIRDEAIITAFLASLAFWATDSSPERLQTEAFVDHISRVVSEIVFSPVQPELASSISELLQFVGQRRVLPLIAPLLASWMHRSTSCDPDEDG